METVTIKTIVIEWSKPEQEYVAWGLTDHGWIRLSELGTDNPAEMMRQCQKRMKSS